jgi:hypothetical protein
MGRRFFLWLACLAAALTAPAALSAAAVTATPMTFVPEALSGDGAAVFGVSGGDVKRWTDAGGGATTVAQFPAGSSLRHVTDASDDGSVIVGRFSPTGSPTSLSPWYWTAASGFQTISVTITSAARVFVSGDGQRIVGDTFTFTAASTVATNLLQPLAIDANGSHVGLAGSSGVARMLVNGVQQTFAIPGDTSGTRVTGFSADGQIAYGYTSPGQNAFRYDASTGVVTTSPLASAWTVQDWSDDGRIGVGLPTNQAPNGAMIRIDGQDQFVSTLLTNAGYDVATLPALNTAFQVSNDGTKFLAGNIGSAVLVTIPEPATVAVLAPAAGLLMMPRRRRPRR